MDIKNTADLCVLAYNNEDIITKTLQNISDNILPYIDCRVLVLDNGSIDNTYDKIRQFAFVEALRVENNRYFSGGANYLLAHCRSDHVFFMSSDVNPKSDTLPKIIEYANGNENAGLISCLSIMPNGEIEKTVKKFYSPLQLHTAYGVLRYFANSMKDKLFDYYYIKEGFPLKSPLVVDVLQDSFLYIRGELIGKIKGYDETLKLYFTEDDICKRAKELGYSAVYLTDTSVYHIAESTTSQDRKKSQKIYISDCLQYCQKYFGNHHMLFLKYDILFANYLKKIIRKIVL